MEIVDVKRDIRLLSTEDLNEWIRSKNEPKYRVGQIQEWLWQKGATSFHEMTSLSKALREKLQSELIIRALSTDVVQESADGTIKTRFSLHDGHKIESVLIPVISDKRYTVCVSTQVGCSLTCAFCATGQMKRERNLDPGEIYDQVKLVDMQCQSHFDASITNIVYMGMGEPLLNLNNTLESIRLISSPQGLGMSPKRITVSTAGIAKMILQLAEQQVKFNLALSLHAATDEKRNEIMPINGSNNLKALMDALTVFHQNTEGKISYEYITFKGFNDSLEDAKHLLRLCKQFPVLVNIIEYNPISGLSFQKSDSVTIDEFAHFLRKNGVMVTVRKSRGKDIDAACGQLANKD